MRDDYYCIVGRQLHHIYGEGGRMIGDCDELREQKAEIERLKAGILSALDELKTGYEVSGIVTLEDLLKGGDGD